MYSRILVALDGSERTEAIVPYVEALAHAFGSVVMLLQARTPDQSLISTPATRMGVGHTTAMTTSLAEAAEHGALAYLTGIAESLRRQGIIVDSMSGAGAPADLILEAARRLPADLIAMVTEGKAGLKRLALGSVAEAVLRDAPCPVLLVRTSTS